MRRLKMSFVILLHIYLFKIYNLIWQIKIKKKRLRQISMLIICLSLWLH